MSSIRRVDSINVAVEPLQSDSHLDDMELPMISREKDEMQVAASNQLDAAGGEQYNFQATVFGHFAEEMASDARSIAEKARLRRQMTDMVIARRDSIDLSATGRLRRCWQKIDVMALFLVLVGVSVAVIAVAGAIIVSLFRTGMFISTTALPLLFSVF